MSAGSLPELSVAGFSLNQGAKLTRRLQGGSPSRRSGDLGRSLKKIKIETSVRTSHLYQSPWVQHPLKTIYIPARPRMHIQSKSLDALG